MKSIFKFLFLSCAVVSGWSCIVCGISYFIFGTPYVGMIERNEWLFSVGMIISGIMSMWSSTLLTIGVLKIESNEEDYLLKVYKFSFDGNEQDFVCAVSVVSAIKLFYESTNISYSDVFSILEDIEPLATNKWETTLIYDRYGDKKCVKDIMAHQLSEGYIGSSVFI